MKFNKLAVVMNPPYQMQSDNQKNRASSGKAQAKPIYHAFIETIIDSLNPDYLVSINPSRWMVGGMGLEKFRNRMMNDHRLQKIVHHPGSFSIFPTVEIAGGINYFLWAKAYNGPCEFVAANTSTIRYLNQYDVIIQDNNAIGIIEKVMSKGKKWMNANVRSNKPFGIPTSYADWQSHGTTCYASGGKPHFISPIYADEHAIIGKYKVVIGKANNDTNGETFRVLAAPFIIAPGAICTETYIVLHVFDTKKEAENFCTYVKTKFFRFLLLQRKPTQDINTQKFAWVPDLQDYSEPWTDKELYKKFGLTRQEIAYVESKIKEIK